MFSALFTNGLDPQALTRSGYSSVARSSAFLLPALQVVRSNPTKESRLGIPRSAPTCFPSESRSGFCGRCPGTPAGINPDHCSLPNCLTHVPFDRGSSSGLALKAATCSPKSHRLNLSVIMRSQASFTVNPVAVAGQDGTRLAASMLTTLRRELSFNIQ